MIFKKFRIFFVLGLVVAFAPLYACNQSTETEGQSSTRSYNTNRRHGTYYHSRKHKRHIKSKHKRKVRTRHRSRRHH